MRRTLLSLSVLASVMTLTGCANPFGQQGYLRDKAGDYTTAKVAEPIKLPEGSNAKEMGDALAVPDTGQSWSELDREFEVPRPAQRLSVKEGDSYSLERDGVNEWLLAAKNPAAIWPGVLGFLEENDVAVASESPKAGVIETGWTDLGEDKEHGVLYRTVGSLVGVADLEPMEDRFRFEIRSGIKANTTEIYVSHQGRPVADGGSDSSALVDWNNLGERSIKMDKSVLGELLIYLARSDVDNSVSKMAQGLSAGSLTDLTKDGNGNPVLTVRELSYARVWAAVSEALINAKLTVIDQNRSAGVFYLAENPQQLDQPVEDKGFWSGLFSSDDDTDKDTEVKAETLTVRVSNFPEVVQVSVEKNVNTSVPVDVSEKLLKRIQDNMK